MGACASKNDHKEGQDKTGHQQNSGGNNRGGNSGNQESVLRQQADSMGLPDINMALDSGLDKSNIKKFRFCNICHYSENKGIS